MVTSRLLHGLLSSGYARPEIHLYSCPKYRRQLSPRSRPRCRGSTAFTVVDDGHVISAVRSRGLAIGHGVGSFRYQPGRLPRLDRGDDRLLAEGWPEFIDTELSIYDCRRFPYKDSVLLADIDSK